MLLVEAATIAFIPYFSKGLWGIITLGETKFHFNSEGVAVYDHSIFLMLQGVISILLIALFIILYLYNVRDAYNPKEYHKKETFLKS